MNSYEADFFLTTTVCEEHLRYNTSFHEDKIDKFVQTQEKLCKFTFVEIVNLIEMSCNNTWEHKIGLNDLLMSIDDEIAALIEAVA